ncbi:MAG: dTDP-4-dehydrorhamnose 3,5-epimerase [Chloroflexi bacterium]|nr:dTDP-4-dehydrorhamnose 3,5-epimerase [Chloroflexota bacterium]MCI0725884.1 dTDP-4-dehydrorhamnose 3,5-epimerase [Chloroflexota bacterium]
MPFLEESKAIAGVYLVHLRLYADERGRFVETFRKEWFPQRSWEIVQSNRSDSAAGVLRGLHYHHHQVDYWYVVRGAIRAGLYDLRPGSPTRGAAQSIELSDDNNLGLFIPIGVAHGFLVLTSATLIYIVDNYYDGGDEFGILWNDPDVGLDWGTADPILSPRDARNPRLAEIPPDRLPR